jgi:iron complex outermembrane receptor protein
MKNPLLRFSRPRRQRKSGRAWILGVSLAIFASGLPALGRAIDPPLRALKKMSVEELMNLEVVSVSRRPEKLSDAASAIQVITGEEIRRSGAVNLPEALRLAENLQVAQKNSHDWGISARGFNTDLANKLLVMIDGRTVYTPLYSGVFWDVQDYLLEDLDRIEVISGPGGTLWGANAVNGVINITSKNAEDTQGGFLEAGGGTEWQSLLGGRYGGTLAPGVYFRVYGKYLAQDTAVVANGSDASDGSRFGRGGFRLDAGVSTANPLTLQGDFYRGEDNMGTSTGTKASGGNLLGRWSHIFSEKSDLALQVYYDRTHLSALKPSNGFAPAGTLTDDLDTYDLDFQHRFPLGERNQVIWGLGYRATRDRVQNAPSVAFLPTQLDQSLYSGFVQDEVLLRRDWIFTFGTKLEHNDYTGFEVEPGIRLQWNFSSKQMLWAAISRAVRSPSRIDRDLLEPTLLPAPLPESILSGGQNFDSESVIAYELGYRSQFRTQLSWSASVFYNEYDSLRSTTPGPPGFPKFGFPLVFENNLEGETYGLELSATYEILDGWRLHAGYNLLREEIRVKAGAVDFSDAHNETADPRHQFSLRSSLDLPHQVELDAGFRWVDSLEANNGPSVGIVPSYAEMDVRLGWRPTEAFEFSLVGQNLLHRQHPEYGFPSPTRGEIERAVYGKAVWRF